MAVADLETVSFEHLSIEAVRSLMEPQPPPCLSLYLPTHRRVPDNRVDRPAFRHLVESLEAALALAHPRDAIERLLHPHRLLADDVGFWEHVRDGVAVLAAEGRARVFLLSRPVEPLTLVAPRFHTAPLVRLAAAREDFDVLTITSRVARVYAGTVWHDPQGTTGDRLAPIPVRSTTSAAPATAIVRADVVDEEVIQPHSVARGMGPAGPGTVHGGCGSKQDDVDADTEIFLRHVDDVVHEQVSRRTRHPLVLVAAGRLAATFRGLSRNPFLLEAHVAKDPHLMTDAELVAAIAPLFAAARSAAIDRDVRAFQQAGDRGLASGDLSDVARAAVAGRVATLLLEADRFEPGRFDRQTGGIEPGTAAPAAELARRGGRAATATEDLLGAVAETVLAKGGSVVAVERIRMPTESGIAAVYRY
jgi:hypothetical protein